MLQVIAATLGKAPPSTFPIAASTFWTSYVLPARPAHALGANGLVGKPPRDEVLRRDERDQLSVCTIRLERYRRETIDLQEREEFPEGMRQRGPAEGQGEQRGHRCDRFV